MGSFDCYCAICGGPMAQVEIEGHVADADPPDADASGSDSEEQDDDDADVSMANNSEDEGVESDNEEEIEEEGEQDEEVDEEEDDESDQEDQSDDDDEAEDADDESDKAESEDNGEDDYEEGRYDPEILKPEDIVWLEDCRVLGFNADADGVSKAFISGPGYYENYGSMTCEAGSDPNCQGVDVPALSCYHDFNQGDPVFPFHWDCYEILARRLSGTTDTTSIDKDVLYSVMQSKAPDYCSVLELDYEAPEIEEEMPSDQFWECRPGEELYVISPSPKPSLSAHVQRDLKRDFAQQSLDPALGAKVKSDIFSKLPPEVLYEMTSFLDHKSLTGLLKASWAVHSVSHNDNSFWKQRIKTSMPWFFELQDFVQSDSALSIASMKSLYTWAQTITEPCLRLKGPYMALANRRRIWSVCDQVADLYLPKLPKTDEGLSETIKNASSCSHMPVVSFPVPVERNNAQVYFAHSWDEFYVPKSIETFWDKKGFLVGISVSIEGRRRLFGVDDSQTGIEIQSFDLKANEWITGIVLHIPELNLVCLGASNNPTVKKLPSTSIKGITFQTSNSSDITMGDTTSGHSQRPFFHPETHRIFGIMGQTGLIDNNPRILRMGLLLVPTASPEDSLLKTSAPLRGPLHRYLWTGQSCSLFSQPIWNFPGLNIRTFPEELVQSSHYIFHPDIIPYEAFVWAQDVKELRELRRITAHVFESGDLSTGTGGIEITKSICNMQADLDPAYKQGPIMARSTEVAGKAFAKFEAISFDIDGSGGERIVEIAAQAQANPETVQLRTNRNRGITWKGQKEMHHQWKYITVPEGEAVVGLLLAFGDPCGFDEASKNYTREHTRLTYLAALTIQEG